MKRTWVVAGIFIIGLIAVGKYDVSAQENVITSREYFAGIYGQHTTRVSRSRRAERKDETLRNGVRTRFVESLSEHLLYYSDHTYTKIVDGDNTTELEHISIGSARYERKNGGSWTVIEPHHSWVENSFEVLSDGINEPPEGPNQYSVEVTSLNGVSVRLFKRMEVRSVDNVLLFDEIRYWVDTNGYSLRNEFTSGKLFPREETRRIITTYEYDPKDLKIEAPIR